MFGTVVSAQPPPAPGSAAAHDFGLFRDSLAPHGEWIETAADGWRWAPRVPADWRPYTRGQWLLTDQGWHWDSDEAFGWATFHYGRWLHDARRGWLWTPGTEWAPAWVSWRHGNGFAGWAPLSPHTAATGREGLATLAGSTVSHDFVFVNERSFLDRGIQRRLLPRQRNVALLDATMDVTHYRLVDDRIINRGIDVESMERAVGHRVSRVRTTDVTRSDAARRASPVEVHVFRPVVQLTDAGGGTAFLHVSDVREPDAGEDAPSYTNARVLALDPSRRTLVVRTADGVEETMQLDDRLAGFGDVAVGDRVILTVQSGPGWARVTSMTKSLPSLPSNDRPLAAPPPDRTPDRTVDPETLAFARTMFDSRVASLAQQAQRVDRVWAEFVSACKVEGLAETDGARGWFALWEGSLRSDLSGGFCRDLFNQIVSLGEPIKASMTAAEDVARRSLDPGEMREIRRRHSMDWGGWALPRPTMLEQ
ncbi:MAG: hypothetical protein NDJ94_10040 [Vicinamibacteria bacterium]|nr:hypothetical protein [Vicinamibacteria bacterium]